VNPLPLSCPPRLQPLWRAATVDAVVGELRHDLNNKLSSIRNCAFYLRRRAEKSNGLLDEPRVKEFFALIETELDACHQLLAPAPISDAGASGPSDGLGTLLSRLVGGLTLPPAIDVVVGELPPSAELHGKVTLALEVAIFALLEGAIARLPAGGTVRIGARRDLAGVWVDVEHSAEASAGPQTQQLRIAERLASLWGGKLAASEGDGRSRASLWVSAPRQEV
jgi:hypothetical protein